MRECGPYSAERAWMGAKVIHKTALITSLKAKAPQTRNLFFESRKLVGAVSFKSVDTLSMVTAPCLLCGAGFLFSKSTASMYKMMY